MVKVAPQRSLIDNWDFRLFGQSNDPRNIPQFDGYVSSIDPTTAGMGVMIGGSQNTYKSILGTVKNRAGLKRRGPADSTDAGVISSFEWETSFGATRVLHAVDGNLQVEVTASDGTISYIDLLTGLSDAEMDFSFAPWYSDVEAKDQLIFVNGQQEINMWEGGMGTLGSATATTIVLSGADSVQEAGFASSGQLLINGAVYDYTGAGIDPNLIYTHNSTDNTPSLNVGIVSTLHSQLFTTSAAATGIVQVIARVKNLAISSERAHFSGSIYTDNAGVPGTLIGSATTSITPAFSAGDWILTFNYTSLAATPATNYHFVLEHTQRDVNSTDFDVYTGASSGVGTNNSTDAGVTWNAEDGYLYMDVYENTASPDTFVGVSPSPAAIPVGTEVVQNVVVSDKTASGNLFAQAFGASFTNDWIRTIGNQLYVGCYNSRLVFESNIENYLNYSIPSLRSPGDANEYVLDTNSRGATSKGGQKGNAVLFGLQGDTYSIVNTVATVQIAAGPSVFAQVENQVIDKQTSSDLSSPLSNDFIDSIGDTIIFLDENNQLRQFGTLRNLATPVYPILSLDVYTELAALDFTGGALRAVAEQSGETVYITSPVSGLTYVYQIREKVDEIGNLGSERLWQPPQVWNISRIAVIDGISYGYSASNPQMYQLWDTGQFYDDSPDGVSELPYESHAIWGYQSLANRTQQLFFDKIYYEGYMTRGTPLYCNVYKEYQGSKGIDLIIVNNPETPPTVKRARFYGAAGAPEMGMRALGQVPLGQGVGGVATDFPKFRTVRSASAEGIFEYALDVFSIDAGAQWEMLVLGTNMQPTPGRSTQLFKKEL